MFKRPASILRFFGAAAMGRPARARSSAVAPAIPASWQAASAADDEEAPLIKQPVSKEDTPKKQADKEKADQTTNEQPDGESKDAEKVIGASAKSKAKAKAKGKGKAKAKAKTKPMLAIADWTNWGEEEEDVEEGEEPAAKRVRSSRVELMPGKDETGADLPKDDDRAWTTKQKYVWEKSKASLDAKRIEEFDEAVKQKDRKQQYRIVNSLVPRNASYAMVVKPIGDEENRLVKVTEDSQIQQKKKRNLGISWTESMGKCNNSETLLNQGIARGDVEVKNGLYYWRSEMTEDIEKHTNSEKAEKKAAISAEDMSALQLSMEQNKSWLTWAQQSSNPDDIHITYTQASEEAFLKMSGAYETIDDSVKQIRNSVRDLSTDAQIHGDASGTCYDLMKKANEQIQVIMAGLQKLDGLLITPRSEITDSVIKIALNEAAKEYEKLLEIGTDVAAKVQSRKKRGGAASSSSGR